jgi:membrane fusion protein (multidrug efflux system)
VQSGQTVLATISVDDPVHFYCSLSERDYLNFVRRSLAAGDKGKKGATPVTLILADDSVYPAKGHFDFLDRAVSSQTGTLMVRARFPNPQGILRPGLFGKIRVEYQALDNVIAVPPKAVQEVLGKYFVTVIDEQDKARSVPVTLGPRLEQEWVIEEGLRPGQRLVVEGLQKAPPGTLVKARMIDQPPASPPAQ